MSIPSLKVQDNHTYLLEEDVRIDSNMGIYVDIFPVDGYENDANFKNKMTKLIKKRQLSCYTFKGITKYEKCTEFTDTLYFSYYFLFHKYK